MDSLYINNQWVKTAKSIDVISPHDNSVVDQAPFATKEQVEEAINAAHAAFQTFQYETAQSKKELLTKWAALIRRDKAKLANLIHREQGKLLSEAEGEIEYGCSFLDWFAAETQRIYGDLIPGDHPNQSLIVSKQPIGVVGAITPWNFPLAMITRKVAPAIAAGCTVVIKPSEETPLVAYELMKLAEEANFPKGVLNMVTGDPDTIGKLFCSHPHVRKISFTGSTRVGKILSTNAAPYIKKLSLELGGNAPLIVFESASIEKALEGALFAKTRNSCQTCICANRLFVHTSHYDQFVDQFAEQFSKVELGPVINQTAVERLTNLIQTTQDEGAELICGGTKVEPTVFANVTQEMSIANQEIFGPIAPFIRFDTEEEVIEMANATPYGLAAYFYSTDLAQITRVNRKLEAGIIGINETRTSKPQAPFGGMKESGIGREGSKYGIEDYLEIKYSCLSTVL